MGGALSLRPGGGLGGGAFGGERPPPSPPPPDFCGNTRRVHGMVPVGGAPIPRKPPPVERCGGELWQGCAVVSRTAGPHASRGARLPLSIPVESVASATAGSPEGVGVGVQLVPVGAPCLPARLTGTVLGVTFRPQTMMLALLRGCRRSSVGALSCLWWASLCEGLPAVRPYGSPSCVQSVGCFVRGQVHTICALAHLGVHHVAQWLTLAHSGARWRTEGDTN